MEKIKTDKLTKDRREFMRKCGYTADTIFPDYPAEELKAKLLAVGGEAVVFMGKLPKHKTLLNKGEFVDGADARLWKMKQSQCHANVEWILANYAKLYKGFTGFALSQDGVWRYHSWAFDTIKNHIVETTEKRLVYYGIKY